VENQRENSKKKEIFSLFYFNALFKRTQKRKASMFIYIYTHKKEEHVYIFVRRTTKIVVDRPRSDRLL